MPRVELRPTIEALSRALVRELFHAIAKVPIRDLARFEVIPPRPAARRASKPRAKTQRRRPKGGRGTHPVAPAAVETPPPRTVTRAPDPPRAAGVAPRSGLLPNRLDPVRAGDGVREGVAAHAVSPDVPAGAAGAPTARPAFPYREGGRNRRGISQRAELLRVLEEHGGEASLGTLIEAFDDRSRQRVRAAVFEATAAGLLVEDHSTRKVHLRRSAGGRHHFRVVGPLGVETKETFEDARGLYRRAPSESYVERIADGVVVLGDKGAHRHACAEG